jgi:hypothetical protein
MRRAKRPYGFPLLSAERAQTAWAVVPWNISMPRGGQGGRREPGRGLQPAFSVCLPVWPSNDDDTTLYVGTPGTTRSAPRLRHDNTGLSTLGGDGQRGAL